MFEQLSYEQILKRMMDRVPSDIDKREGSVIYNALAPAAAELKTMYTQLDWMLDQSFADTQSREYLIRRCAERGLEPEQATKAVLEAEFNQEVSIGSRFSLNMLNYVVIECIDKYKNRYKLECETPGTEGNKHFGSLIPIEYIPGLTSAELYALLIPGEDEEDTEQLRKRYFSSLNSQAFGGNIADYKAKTNSIKGVGGTKVFPTPYKMGGRVKLVIVDSLYQVPDKELVYQVQETIDPTYHQGQGMGLAPIGHTVEVNGAYEHYIDISTNITYQKGWTWKDIEPYVNQKIDQYFQELCASWADNEYLIVRVSQIESRLLDISGILDISDTYLNKEPRNLELMPEEIPVRGGIYG